MGTKNRYRAMHVIRGVTPDAEWLMTDTAARRAVTLVLQESDDPLVTMYAALEYAVCLASGAHTRLLPDPSPDEAERIAPLRPCRVVFGAPVFDGLLLTACGVLVINLVERLQADETLVSENL